MTCVPHRWKRLQTGGSGRRDRPVGAPFDERSDLFLEAWFHQGSLDFPPGFVVRMQRIADQCPLILDVTLDRPVILTPLVDVASALTASYATTGRVSIALGR